MPCEGDGLLVAVGDGVLIHGLIVNRFCDHAIEVENGASNARIAGSVLSTDPAGTADRGNASFSCTSNPPIAAGRSVTATATDADGNTSAFSAAVPVTASGLAAGSALRRALGYRMLASLALPLHPVPTI